MKRRLHRPHGPAPNIGAEIAIEPLVTVTAPIQPLAVTPREVCRMLSIGMTRFYELLAAGEFDDFQVGRSRRITTASIHAYIERQRATTRFCN